LISQNAAGVILVSRDTLDQCDPNGGGCGTGVEHGFGHTYRLTFIDIQVPEPIAQVIDVTFIGGPVVGGANREVMNIKTFAMSNTVTTVRVGGNIQMPESGEVQLTNEWLTPFYVMLFDTRPPGDLDLSLKQCKFSIFVDSIIVMKQITLPSPTSALYLKIQRLGFGTLALAEVQIFEEKYNTMSSYSYGSPVAASSLMNPYQPEEPFSFAFNQQFYDGEWYLQVDQLTDYSPPIDHHGSSEAVGSLSEFVIIVTDMAGVLHTHYQDIRAELTSLPKYGSLMLTKEVTSSPYSTWRDAFEVASDGQLMPLPGGERHLGICYGSDISNSNGVKQNDIFKHCLDSFGVGPNLDNRLLGDVPYTKILTKRKDGYL
jgi:hypothetical protein